jgi:alanine racemase
MHRSEVTVDLGAVRRNARTLLRLLDGAELWSVVKADAYGHGALDVARVVVEEGAGALCVATVPEGLELRAELPTARILVMGPSTEVVQAREAGLELAVWAGEVPEGVRVHLKLGNSTPGWAAGGSRSCPSRLPESSG